MDEVVPLLVMVAALAVVMGFFTWLAVVARFYAGSRARP